MSDWQQIDTGAQDDVWRLNRAIGERLGYIAKLIPDDEEWAIFAPDGTQTSPGFSYTLPEDERDDPDFDNEEFCWKTAYEVDRRNDHRDYEPPLIPDWAGDLNAAASLPLPDNRYLEIKVYLDGITHVSIISTSYMDKVSPDVVARSEAEARARAWLAWHEATQKTNAGSQST